MIYFYGVEFASDSVILFFSESSYQKYVSLISLHTAHDLMSTAMIGHCSLAKMYSKGFMEDCSELFLQKMLTKQSL